MNSLILVNGKYLHSLIYFVADQPSEDNISPSVPLVGTPSYKNLLNWIADMNIDITRVRMYNQIDKPFDNTLAKTTLNKAIEIKQIKVIALGQKAAKYLNNAGIEEYFVLPHPSPLNRLINDKDYIKNKLGACEKYIYEGVIPSKEFDYEETQDELSEG